MQTGASLWKAPVCILYHVFLSSGDVHTINCFVHNGHASASLNLLILPKVLIRDMTAAASVEITFKMFSINFSLSMGSSFHFQFCSMDISAALSSTIDRIYQYTSRIYDIETLIPIYSLNSIKRLYIIKLQAKLSNFLDTMLFPIR